MAWLAVGAAIASVAAALAQRRILRPMPTPREHTTVCTVSHACGWCRWQIWVASPAPAAPCVVLCSGFPMAARALVGGQRHVAGRWRALERAQRVRVRAKVGVMVTVGVCTKTLSGRRKARNGPPAAPALTRSARAPAGLWVNRRSWPRTWSTSCATTWASGTVWRPLDARRTGWTPRCFTT